MDREEEIRRQQGQRLKAARRAAGFKSAAGAAKDTPWAESTYRAHEAGTRTIGHDDAEKYAKRYRLMGVKVTGRDILFGSGEPSELILPQKNLVPIMGLIGAGAVIEPEFEQISDDGLHAVELPFPVPGEMIGLEVRGDSMRPRYDEGDVIVVWREQRRGADTFIGEEAAVRTSTGRRYLKEIAAGGKRGTFTLYSFNARPIADMHLEWIGEIYATVRASQVKRVEIRRRAAGARASRR